MQDISNTLWAYATLRHYPGSELLDGAAKQAVSTIQRFKPQEVANTLWSYATLGHDPQNLLLDAMAGQMAERIQHFRPQAISNSLWAYAKLGYNPGRSVTHHHVLGLTLWAHTCMSLCSIFWAKPLRIPLLGTQASAVHHAK